VKEQRKKYEVRSVVVVLVMVLAVAGAACKKKVPPIAKPMPPASSTGSAVPPTPPRPPEPVSEPVPVPVEPMPEDALSGKTLDDLNRDSPLKPVFYELDSSDLSADAQRALQENAQVMKKYATLQVTIEGHSDERGTAEYNLALGERRALTARDYLVSLGIPATRLRTVSYGKEFPFDPGHTEAAWLKNRRAHFVITAK
jgi:peptidoglycan-associated lipoprotein